MNISPSVPYNLSFFSFLQIIMSKKYTIAIVGATGAVGDTLISILDQRKFPIENLYPLASKRSAGSKVS